LPIGALVGVLVLDLLGERPAATAVLVLAILGMLAAALTGLADYSDTEDDRPRDVATVHATLMVLALVLLLVSLAIRSGDPTDTVAPAAISFVGLLLVSFGAFLGGDLVFALGNMVDRHAWRPAGTKWQPLEVGELAEGRPTKGKLGAQALVLVREGDTIHALHDTCAHAGGPLSQGTLEAGCIVCPWHGSRFRLADGRVVGGPSVYDQPRYEVRLTADGGLEARRLRT
ncbi:MAG: Rieske 2Fe-2S domain-containing protein, partial [Candidatus Limnocylindrales bacterium]